MVYKLSCCYGGYNRCKAEEFWFINHKQNLLFVYIIITPNKTYFPLNSAAHQQLIDELKEKQFKYQQDTNKFLGEIGSLQEKLNLYE